MRDVSRAEVEDNLKTLHSRSKKIVEETGGHPPLLFLVRGEEIETIDFTTYIEDKDLMEVMLKAYKNQVDVDASILLTEAWTLAIDKDSELGKQISAGLTEFPLPSESPDRQEVLFYMVETRRGKTFSAQAVIIRDSDNDATVGPLTMMADEDAELVGRFVGGILNS